MKALSTILAAVLVVVFNLNTVTQSQLETLPGVGPSLARKIIEFRREKGGFNRMEELLAVPGVSEKKWLTLKEYLQL